MAKLSPEQIARLMGGLSVKKRASLVGVAPIGVPENRMFSHIAGSATRNERPAVPIHNDVATVKTIDDRAATILDGQIITVNEGEEFDDIGAALDAFESRDVDYGNDRVETTAYTPKLIQLDGAPRTIEESELTSNLNFDDSQKAAFKVLTRHGHTCLIGAAGTGKTTMVKQALGYLIYGDESLGITGIGIRRLSGDQGPSIAVCAFTGIATQVVRAMLPEWLHPCVKTIHSLLEYKPANAVSNDYEGRGGMFIPTRTAGNKFEYDIVVIDEASMLGLDLWHNVIDAAPAHTIFILIGDLNQLKPVADATFFAYALSAGIDKKYGWDIAELTTIHRQKEAAANKIIDAAHSILNGKKPVFDNPQTDINWRCIGFNLPVKSQDGHMSIVGAINYLRKQPTPEFDGYDAAGNAKYRADTNRMIFDPYKDLLLCAGNGYDENDSASFVQQKPLNETLSRQIEPPNEEHPVFYIDAGRETRKFAIGHRVMATKNESPDTKDRVTNGLTGRIIDIQSNSNWKGNKAMFGTEKEVMNFRAEKARSFIASATGVPAAGNAMGVDFDAFNLAAIDTSSFEAETKEEEKQASHIVTVKFVNNAERTYRTAADVGGLMLAYAITTHKAQGSQADTVVVVVHQAVKKQLSREWLYTAVTRARRRVIILYTDQGLAVALARQQIYGQDLREKVNRYRDAMGGSRVFVRLEARKNVLEGIVERSDIAEIIDRDDSVDEQEFSDD